MGMRNDRARTKTSFASVTGQTLTLNRPVLSTGFMDNAYSLPRLFIFFNRDH